MKIIAQNKTKTKANQRRADKMKKLIFSMILAIGVVSITTNAFARINRNPHYIWNPVVEENEVFENVTKGGVR
jgi:hypothetical protein